MVEQDRSCGSQSARAAGRYDYARADGGRPAARPVDLLAGLRGESEGRGGAGEETPVELVAPVSPPAVLIRTASIAPSKDSGSLIFADPS